MSINLCFAVQGGGGYVEFPIQTPSKLTKKVLAERSKQGRLVIIEEYLHESYSILDTANILSNIELLMDNNCLTLSYI